MNRPSIGQMSLYNRILTAPDLRSELIKQHDIVASQSTVRRRIADTDLHERVDVHKHLLQPIHVSSRLSLSKKKFFME